MSNPADNIETDSPGIGREVQGTDNFRARAAFIKSAERLQWNATITDDQVKDDSGQTINGKYKVTVNGFDDDLDAYIIRTDDKFKKGEAVVVNIDTDQVAWIISPAFPRGTGFGLCLMIIDDLSPGTWGISLPRFGSGISLASI